MPNEKIRWRYCGQYNNTRQHPMPGHGWISGAEARRRYDSHSHRSITAVSPLDGIDRRRPQLTLTLTQTTRKLNGTVYRTVTRFHGHDAHDYTATEETLTGIDTKALCRPTPAFGDWCALR